MEVSLGKRLLLGFLAVTLAVSFYLYAFAPKPDDLKVDWKEWIPNYRLKAQVLAPVPADLGKFEAITLSDSSKKKSRRPQKPTKE